MKRDDCPICGDSRLKVDGSCAYCGWKDTGSVWRLKESVKKSDVITEEKIKTARWILKKRKK